MKGCERGKVGERGEIGGAGGASGVKYEEERENEGVGVGVGGGAWVSGRVGGISSDSRCGVRISANASSIRW